MGDAVDQTLTLPLEQRLQPLHPSSLILFFNALQRTDTASFSGFRSTADGYNSAQCVFRRRQQVRRKNGTSTNGPDRDALRRATAPRRRLNT